MDELKRIKKEKIKKLMKRMEINRMKIEIEANDNNFEKEVIERSKNVPVVVDFWAQWCAPCLMLSPTLEKFVKEYDGKFILAKVNVDEARTASYKYGITSIPCVKMFKDGEVVDEFVGALPEEQVKGWLNKNKI